MAGVNASKKQQPFHVSLTDDRILRSIYDFHFVTTQQLVRLHYSKSSHNYVRERLKGLVEAEYLMTFPAPRTSLAGKSALVYQLTVKAIRYLQQAGYDANDRRLRPSERPIGDQFTLHTLAINDVLIAARLLDQAEDDISTAAMRHERDLKRTASAHIPTGKDDPSDEKTYVIPDAWVEFRLGKAGGKRMQRPVWLEIDRSSENIRSFKRKIRGIVGYYEAGHYERIFGTKHISVAVAVVQTIEGSVHGAGSKRIKDVTRWIEEELRELGEPGWNSVFYIGPLEDGNELDAIDFFLSPRWHVPFHDSPISLLDLPSSDS
jgi:Replication-relaxation